MKGDRVRLKSIVPFANESKQPITCVYKPRIDGNGNIMFGNDGTAMVELAGGVPDGTTGVIDGPFIHVHRSQLKEYQAQIGMGVNEKMPLFPIRLDVYQQVAWVCGDCLSVFAGGV